MCNFECALCIEMQSESQLIAKLLRKSAGGETVSDAVNELSTLFRV
jgi:hypothetical protein